MITKRLEKVADALLKLEEKCHEEGADVSLYMDQMIDVLSKANVSREELIILDEYIQEKLLTK